MAIRFPFSKSVVGRVAAGVALAAVLVVGLAPAAHAWHPEVFADVDCTDDGVILEWRAVSWMGDDFYGVDYYNPDVRVYLQYGTASTPIGAIDGTQIGAGAFTSSSLAFDCSLTLSPPAGATRVRVHSEALGTWESGNQSLPHEAQTTAWLTLPLACGETQQVTIPTTTPEAATTATVAEVTTSTTAASTTSTAAPSAVLSGRATAPAQVAVPAQAVSTQAVPAQTLPVTGSATGTLAAVAVVMIALGGGLYAASRTREVRPIPVRVDDTPSGR